MTWRATVLTLFPGMFPGPLGHSLAGKALANGVWSLDAVDIREHGLGRHRSVDDTPFGGGAGMVMRPDVVDAAIGAVADGRPLLFLTPRGRPLAQADAQRLPPAGRHPAVRPLRGHRPAGDRRQRGGGDQHRRLRAVRRRTGRHGAAGCLRPAAAGRDGGRRAPLEESFTAGLLEYPHYTRPAEWAGRAVPDVLLSGNHAAIAAWRRRQAEEITRARRPDLLCATIATGAAAP